MARFVEWLDGGTLLRGVLKEKEKGKLRITSLTGRTLSVPARRFHLIHEAVGDAAAFFQDVDREAEAVDLELLHGTVEGGATLSLEALAAAWFSSDPPSTRELSVILSACLRGGPWFKVEGSGRVRAAGAEEVARFQGEAEARARRAEETAALEEMLRRGAAGGGLAALPPERVEQVSERLLQRLLGEASGEPWPALEAALSRAARDKGLTHAALARAFLRAAGRLPDPYRVHVERFCRAFFTEPPGEAELVPCMDRYPAAPEEEVRTVAASVDRCLDGLPGPRNGTLFSVDDAGVLEIDDAISVEPSEGDRFRVGVHIAAPGLFVGEETEIHARAAAQCTTVYQPDGRWTLLPLPVIQRFSLGAGVRVPAVSTYFTFDTASLRLLETEHRLEAVVPSANHTYDALEEKLEGAFVPGLEALAADPERARPWVEEDPRAMPWRWKGADAEGLPRETFELLVPLARRLLKDRVREGAPLVSRREFRVKAAPDGTVTVTERRRNGIVEGIVTELMILANAAAADRLAAAGLPAVYRTQRVVTEGGPEGAVLYRSAADLTVVPREHAGLGRGLYCWSTSPLRRYADLLNQRQLGSLLGGPLPPFMDTSELLVRAKKTEFQQRAAEAHERRMERFFVLKHMEARPGVEYRVEVKEGRQGLYAEFLDLPLRIPLEPAPVPPPEPAEVLRFTPEAIDLYGLDVTGRFSRDGTGNVQGE